MIKNYCMSSDREAGGRGSSLDSRSVEPACLTCLRRRLINASRVHSSALHTPSVWNLPSLRFKTICNLASCPRSRSSNYQTAISSNHHHVRRALGEQAASLRDSSFTSEALNKSHRLHQHALAFLCPYGPPWISPCASLVTSVIVNQTAEAYFRRLSAFWWAIDFQNMGLCRESVDRWSRGSAAAASRRPALLCYSAAQWSCSAAPVLSLAWLTSLHLMVYSFHSGAGCCAMRIFSHSIYLPRTIFCRMGTWTGLLSFGVWSNSHFQSWAKTANILSLLSMTTDVLFFYGVIAFSLQFLVFISINIPPLFFVVLGFWGRIWVF